LSKVDRALKKGQPRRDGKSRSPTRATAVVVCKLTQALALFAVTTVAADRYDVTHVAGRAQMMVILNPSAEKGRYFGSAAIRMSS